MNHPARVRPGDPPTPAQRKVLLFLREHQSRHGLLPTVRAVCEHFGWASPNAVMEHYQGLARRGLVELSPRGFRVLRLVGATWTFGYEDGEAGRRLRAALHGDEAKEAS